jgi:hypothetical protein
MPMRGSRVCWQRAGVRHDAFAQTNRLVVETDEPEGERGYFLHPAAIGQPATRMIDVRRGRGSCPKSGSAVAAIMAALAGRRGRNR